MNRGLLLIIWMLAGASCRNLSGSTENTAQSPTLIYAATETAADTLSIIAVGDVMLGTSFPEGYLPPEDGRHLLDSVRSLLQDADLTFGNYEGTLFNGAGTMKKCSDSTKCYAFKTPEQYAHYLAAAGFDLMSVANNHSGDFGPEARRRTLEVLSSVNIAAAGSLEVPTTIIKKGNLTIGLAAFSPNRGCPDLNNLAAARRKVRRLDSLCDIVIVSFHGGAEGAKAEHVPKAREVFVGENRGNVYLFAHRMIEEGADLVLGHGPHVTRALELYKGRLIAYSLGNFATYGRFNLKGPNGIAPILKVRLNRKGVFLNGQITPIRQEGEGVPVPDTSRAVIKRIRQLTAADFPHTPLRISPSGKITRK